VITWHNRGTSEYPPRVRSELAPRYRRRDDGQRNRGSYRETNIRPVVSQCFSGKYPPRNRAAKSGSQGRALSAPAIAVAKTPQCPQSVDAPLSPGKSRQIAESTIRFVSGVTGAPLPHQRPQFRSRSGRLHPHQATARALLRQTWTANTEGNSNRERDYIALRMGTWLAPAPLTRQLRPHQRSVANIGTVPLAFTWLITPTLRR
jgi:hypothetical protein